MRLILAPFALFLRLRSGLKALPQGRSWFDRLATNGLIFVLMLFAQSAVAADALPRPDHIVIVVEENKSFSQIIGNREAPYINALARRGMLFTNSHGITHPSQPNRAYRVSTHSSRLTPLES